MKRFVSIFLAIVLCISLSACGKSEAAQKVDDMIAAIDTVDIQSGDAILEAEMAYEELSGGEKRSLKNYQDLVKMRKTFDQLRADQAIDAIQSIGYVNDNSGLDIQNARRIYDDLTDAEQKLVSNYEELAEAEEEYIRIKVTPVEQLISKVSAFDRADDSLPDGFADAVDAANEAYEKLDNTLKEKVNNYEELESATAYLSDYRVKHLIAYIDENLTEIGFESGEKLQVAQVAYQLMDDKEKAKITNYNVLEKAQEEYDKLQPIQLNSYRLGKDLIGDPELFLNATNVSDKIVKEFSMTVFAYDEDGVPVSIYLGDYSKGLRYGSALKPGENTKSNTYWTLYGTYNEMKQIVVILKDVEFFDGTTWSNNEYGTLRDKYEQQLLTSGDTNILSRS